jgi:hypothetical protein
LNEQDAWTLRITAALEAKPSIPVPEDFSSRMAARLPSRPATTRVIPKLIYRSHYGRITTQAMLAVLLAGMLLASALERHSGAWSVVQITLFSQFCALMLWLVLSRRRVF